MARDLASIENEIWRDISGYEHRYMVSSRGRVKSLVRPFCIKEIILKQSIVGSGYYAVSLSKDGKSKMHRVNILVACAFLLDFDFALQVEHKDQDKLNNNLSNLRMSTRSQNNMNRTKDGRSTCSSQFKGVSWSKVVNKWHAYIKLNGKRRHIGYFVNEVDAAKAYDKKAVELFKEFSCTNAMQLLYNLQEGSN